MITMPAGYPYRRKSWVKRLRGHNYVETVPQELLQWVPDTHIKLRDALELLGSTELSDWTSNESEASWYTQSPDRPGCWSENADDLPELFIFSENGEIVQTDEDGADSWWQVIEPILIAEWHEEQAAHERWLKCLNLMRNRLATGQFVAWVLLKSGHFVTVPTKEWIGTNGEKFLRRGIADFHQPGSYSSFTIRGPVVFLKGFMASNRPSF